MKMAAIVSGLVLCVALIAVAQTTRIADERVALQAGTPSPDPTPATTADPLADFLTPAPMGPQQRFAVAPRPDTLAQTFTPPQRSGGEIANTRMRAQAERPRFKHKATQTASARPLRLDRGSNQVSGGEPALAFAPVERKPTRLLQPCFPAYAFDQNGLKGCTTAAPSYRGRFEELLRE
jgi:hypothetical protein